MVAMDELAAVPFVVDTQAHLNLLGAVECSIAAMDALGIQAVVIDEWWGSDVRGVRLPHFRVGNAVRHIYPFASEAAFRFPHRFAYTAWVDPGDPRLTEVVQEIADNPQQVAIRIVATQERDEDSRIAAGRYDELLSAAQQLGVPVKLALTRTDMARRIEVLGPLFTRFPTLQFIIDHCGVIRLSDTDLAAGMNSPTVLGTILGYAEFPNVAIQWCHAQTLSCEAYPWLDVLDYLRKFLDAFGVERIMWAGDPTHADGHHTWAESLFSIRDTDILSAGEKHLVLGGNARRVFGWPSEVAPNGDQVATYRASSWRSQAMLAGRVAAEDQGRR
jgi:L-fuconolactonase